MDKRTLDILRQASRDEEAFREMVRALEAEGRDQAGSPLPADIYARLFESSPEAIVIADSMGRIVELNERIRDLLGYDPDEIRGLSLAEVPFLGPEARRKAGGMLRARMNGETIPPYELEFITRDGRRRVGLIRGGTLSYGGGPADYDIIMISDITALKRGEIELDRFYQLSEDLLCIAGMDGYFKRMNPAFEKVLGYSLEELRGIPYMELIHPDDRQQTAGELKKLAGGEATFNFECRFIRSDGGRRWLSWSATPVPEEGLMYAVARDVTELKAREDALRESEERFRRLADSSPVMVWMSGTEGKCTYFNQTWLEFTGRSLEQELGDGWVEGVHGEDVEPCISQYEKAFEAREPFSIEYRLRRQDGIYRWILDNGMPRFDPQGRFEGYIGSCIDIDERKRATEQLDRFFETSSDLLCIAGTDGYFKRVNPTFERLFGYTEEEFLSRPFIELVHPDDVQKTLDEVSKLSRGNVTLSFINRYRCKDGGYRWISWNTTPVPDEGLLYAVAHDVTGLISTEEALRDSRERLVSVLDNVVDGIISADANGVIESVNPAAQEIFGYSEQEMLGRNVSILMPEPYAGEHDSYMRRYRETGEAKIIGQTREVTGKRNSGEEFPIELAVTEMRVDNQRKYVGIVRDITQRKMAERRQKDLENALRVERNLFVAGPTVVFKWAADDGWPVEYVSPNVRELLGWEAEELVSGKKSYPSIVYPEDLERVADEVSEHVDSGKPYFDQEYRLVRKDGKVIWVYDFTWVVRKPDDSVQSFVGYLLDTTERREIEERLRESESRLSLALEAVNDGIWDWNIRTGEVYFSPRWFTMLGYEPGELPGNVESWEKIVHSEDMPAVMEAIEAHLRGETEYYNTIHRCRTRQGEWRWILDRGQVIERDGKGEPVRAVGTHTDVTERVQAEEALRRSEASLAEAQRLASIGNWEWDMLSGRILWSDEVYRIFGIDPGSIEITFEQYISFIHPEDLEHLNRAVNRALEEKEQYTIEHRIRNPDGRERWVQGHGEVSCGPDGEPVKMFGTVQDITDRKRAEDRSALLASIVDSTDDAVTGKTMDLEIISWNKGAEQMYGYTADEIKGKNVAILIPEDRREEELTSLREKISAGEKIDRLETQRVRKDGRLIDVSITLSPIKDSEGRTVGISTIARDISHEKEIDRMKNDFVSMVSHELRTPLTSIKGYVDLILEGDTGEVNELQEEFLGIVSSNAERLGNLINDVLDIEKMESGRIQMKLEKVDLSRLVDLSAKTMIAAAESKGLEMKLDVREGIHVSGDSERLMQAVINLLSNAIKFTPEGEVGVSLAREKKSAVIVVRDTGVGISEDDREKLFTRFFRSENEYARTAGGTGLGLSIVKSIIEKHGGTVEVESRLGEGSRFIIRLPLIK